MGRIRKVPPRLTPDLWNDLVDDYVSQTEEGYKQTVPIEQCASYIIFIKNGTVYARNGLTGKIDYQGPDASVVIQSAVDALTSGGTIFFKAGSYVILKTLTVQTDFIWLIGEGRDAVELKTPNDIHVISLDKPDHSALSKIKIANMRIYGKGAGSTKACIYCRKVSSLPMFFVVVMVRVDYG